MQPNSQQVGILLSQVGAVNIVFLPRATLHVFFFLLESVRAWTGLPEGIDHRDQCASSEEGTIRRRCVADAALYSA